MGDLADVYEETRGRISDLVRGLSREETEKPVPATPGWRIRDVVSHLAGDVASLIRASFPAEFFMSLGEAAAVARLNEWTDEHVTSRAHMEIPEILDEWDGSARTLVGMMREQIPWPEGVPPLATAALVTDIGVHLHDLYGALGIARDREGAPVRIGVAGYVAVMDMRLKNASGPGLRIEAGEKSWTIGPEEPAAVLRSNRFELFRAMSGRRSPDQIRAYDWDGDPEPFVDLFYIYGVRKEPLVE